MMITLKVTPYENHSGIEATWLDQTQAPDIEIPGKAAIIGEDGVEISPAEPASIQKGTITETQIKCVSYHPTQMQMFRDDAAALGTDLTEYESLMVEIEAAYIPPAPEPVQVPQVVTIRQAKLALLQAGLLDDVDAAVAQADRATQIEWEYATEVKRNWPTISKLQVALGMTDSQIDDLFLLAESF